MDSADSMMRNLIQNMLFLYFFPLLCCLQLCSKTTTSLECSVALVKKTVLKAENSKIVGFPTDTLNL